LFFTGGDVRVGVALSLFGIKGDNGGEMSFENKYL